MSSPGQSGTAAAMRPCRAQRPRYRPSAVPVAGPARGQPSPRRWPGRCSSVRAWRRWRSTCAMHNTCLRRGRGPCCGNCTGCRWRAAARLAPEAVRQRAPARAGPVACMDEPGHALHQQPSRADPAHGQGAHEDRGVLPHAGRGRALHPPAGVASPRLPAAGPGGCGAAALTRRRQSRAPRTDRTREYLNSYP